MTDLIESLELCNECSACLEVCPTYQATKNDDFSPIGRIKNAGKILQDGDVTPQMIESIYSCPECHLCTGVCPYEINVPEAVLQSRIELVNRGLAPLEKQNAIIAGIQKLDNAVNGDPSKRLDWLPEERPAHESSTLLYVGCLASYMVKEAAASSYRLLKELGFDFMILPDEGCCGIYYNEVGKLDLAREKFTENVARFKEAGIKRIVVTIINTDR